MKKFASMLMALVMVAAVLTGCGGGSGSAKGGDLKFTTGGDQGTYYGFGSVLAGQVSSATSTKVTAITSGGSKANIENLAAGDAQLGFVQSDVMAYGYNGTRLFEKAETGFSTVAALYMEQVQIVTLDPSIKSVADLKGKTVSIGDAGSGVNFNAIDILGAYGLDSEDDVYNFVSGIFENVETITTSHAKGAELDLDFAASVTSVPYHKGAAKYFSEKGLTVATK